MAEGFQVCALPKISQECCCTVCSAAFTATPPRPGLSVSIVINEMLIPLTISSQKSLEMALLVHLTKLSTSAWFDPKDVVQSSACKSLYSQSAFLRQLGMLEHLLTRPREPSVSRPLHEACSLCV